jgi:hypothetical protein
MAGRRSPYGNDDAVQYEDWYWRFERNSVQSPARLFNHGETWSVNCHATKSGAHASERKSKERKMHEMQILRQPKLLRLTRIAKTMSIVGASALLLAMSHHETFAQGAAPYENMPDVAPIGERISPYLPVPDSAKGMPIDATKGYRIEKLGRDLFMVTDNAYQSMFMV